MTSDLHKTCPRCREQKFFTAFSKNICRPDGRQDECKSCKSERQIAWRKTRGGQESLAKDYARDRNRRLQRTFGITQETFDSLLAAQNGQCAICHTTEPSSIGFCVEHCHDTGVVRGITCAACNTSLGHLKDNPVNAAAILVYLAAHGKALTTSQLNEFLEVYEPTDTE